MPRLLRARLTDGSSIEFDADQKAGVGAEKAAFFTPDRSRVVLFFLAPLTDRQGRSDRLRALLGPRNLTTGPKGAFWSNYFLWPTGMIDHDPGLPPDFLRAHTLASPTLGLVANAYPPEFFFRDRRTGEPRVKDGKWFTGNKARRMLPPEERGDLAGYLRVCIAMTRAVRRMHFSGLAHADLSNKNVLIDPRRGAARLLDLDSLVVPGFAPPSVLGTPGYIAPEVLAGKGSPSIETDRHALAVLIYETLLVRHPLRGPRVHDPDPEVDERLSLGERAVFVEDEDDLSNRLVPPPAVPFTTLGPPLAALFRRVFGPGLHRPAARPTADEWERALYQTIDLIHPVPEGGDWMIIAPGMPRRSPYTHTPISFAVPYAHFHRPRPGETGGFQSEDHGLTIYNGRLMLPWQRRVRQWPDENAPSRQEQARFTFLDGRWFLTNLSDEPMEAVGESMILRGDRVEIRPGLQLRLASAEDARLAIFEFLEDAPPRGGKGPH